MFKLLIQFFCAIAIILAAIFTYYVCLDVPGATWVIALAAVGVILYRHGLFRFL